MSLDELTPVPDIALIRPKPRKPRARPDIFPRKRKDDYDPGHEYGLHRSHVGFVTAVKRCYKALAPIRDTFDMIYVTGQSGIIPASVIAWRLEKSLIILRKKGETSHGTRIEGDTHHNYGRYIILDDFVSSGKTLNDLIDNKPPFATLAGVCLYGQRWYEREVEDGYTKNFNIPVFDPKNTHTCKLVRRSLTSLMFDLTITPCTG